MLEREIENTRKMLTEQERRERELKELGVTGRSSSARTTASERARLADSTDEDGEVRVLLLPSVLLEACSLAPSEVGRSLLAVGSLACCTVQYSVSAVVSRFVLNLGGIDCFVVFVGR